MAHHIPLRRWNKRRVALVVCSALLTAVVSALAAAVKLSNAVPGGVPAAKAAAPPAVSRQGEPDEEVETEIVSILPTGFEPSQITRPRGKFRLMVNNRSGIEQLTWRLDRDAGGGRLHEVQLNRGKLRSQQYEDLPPGTYFLSEADHPDWACRITITPN